ncbi:hypothetical protein Syun_031330 [Stephania yunnanensis]|uniref:Uncharacterized protein n=1 Tax=Stephania yunnanensis TaxID=152371 RepID=A0AAP0E1B4_9MAGN
MGGGSGVERRSTGSARGSWRRSTGEGVGDGRLVRVGDGRGDCRESRRRGRAEEEKRMNESGQTLRLSY